MEVPTPRQWPKGPDNELHFAARHGSMERALALLSRGVIDIDQGDPKGFTPLMLAAFYGHSRVLKVILNKRANVSVVNDDGCTALHMSAQEGHLAVTKLLVQAGADPEMVTFTTGYTPLQQAAQNGHSEVVRVLIEAGATPNSRALDGATPLYRAADNGHVDAVKVLLRAGANPLLAKSIPPGAAGAAFVPLDVAAYEGHSKVVDELIQEHGIEGCGGASGGVHALRAAAERQHLEIMGTLTSAGVVDTGMVLQGAASRGRESSVKFLLLQGKWSTSDEGAGYLDTVNRFGATSLICSISACRPCSSRISRLLIDTGATTTSAVRLTNAEGKLFFNDTPLAYTNFKIREEKNRERIHGKRATESQLHSLEAIRRLLLRVEAVHAVSWLWASDVPSITHAASGGKGEAKTISTPLTSMLPVLRRRMRRPRVLFAALFR